MRYAVYIHLGKRLTRLERTGIGPVEMLDDLRRYVAAQWPGVDWSIADWYEIVR